MNVRDYARAQQRPLGPLRKLIRAVLHALGVPVTPAQVEQVAQRLYRPVLATRAANYRVAQTYLASEHVSPILVPPPRDYPIAALTSAIEQTVTDLRIAGEPITEKTRTDTRVIEVARVAIEGPVTRQSLEPARETVAAIGEDQPHYGWARVLVGPRSCSFCAMLASRGAVYTSKAAALGRGGTGLGAFHSPYVGKSGKLVGGLCDCVAVMVHEGRGWEGEDASIDLENLWLDETEGHSGKDARNAFRRTWEAKVRAGETHLFLPESLQPKAA